MTHRAVATSVRFLTGHARASGEADLDEAVAAAADPHTTLIVYMGLKMLPTLTAQLLGALDIHCESRCPCCLITILWRWPGVCAKALFIDCKAVQLSLLRLHWMALCFSMLIVVRAV